MTRFLPGGKHRGRGTGNGTAVHQKDGKRVADGGPLLGVLRHTPSGGIELVDTRVPVSPPKRPDHIVRVVDGVEVLVKKLDRDYRYGLDRYEVRFPDDSYEVLEVDRGMWLDQGEAEQWTRLRLETAIQAWKAQVAVQRSLYTISRPSASHRF